MKSKEQIEYMYNTLIELQKNNIDSSSELDGFRRALYWVLNDFEV